MTLLPPGCPHTPTPLPSHHKGAAGRDLILPPAPPSSAAQILFRHEQDLSACRGERLQQQNEPGGPQWGPALLPKHRERPPGSRGPTQGEEPVLWQVFGNPRPNQLHAEAGKRSQGWVHHCAPLVTTDTRSHPVTRLPGAGARPPWCQTAMPSDPLGCPTPRPEVSCSLSTEQPPPTSNLLWTSNLHLCALPSLRGYITPVFLEEAMNDARSATAQMLLSCLGSLQG